MKNENKEELLRQLAQYGYELSVPASPAVAPERVLEALLRQGDTRLLEGFPIVLASALLQNGALAWENKSWLPGKAFAAKTGARWVALMAISLLLFRLFGLEKTRQDRVLKLLRKYTEWEKFLTGLERDLAGEEVPAGDLRLSADRIKNSFRNYLVLQAGSGKELEEHRNALTYELLLSELFTVRQKEILRKRLTGKTMTKTEREYYYRVVKKRLRALADPRLHQMARSLVLPF